MADTCGPGPFSLGNPETARGILEAAGFVEIELHQRDFDYFMGADMDEAIDSLLAIGPGAELIRLNGDYGESRRGEIAEALKGSLRRPAEARRLDRRPRVRVDRRGHEPRLASGVRIKRPREPAEGPSAAKAVRIEPARFRGCICRSESCQGVADAGARCRGQLRRFPEVPASAIDDYTCHRR